MLELDLTVNVSCLPGTECFSVCVESSVVMVTSSSTSLYPQPLGWFTTEENLLSPVVVNRSETLGGFHSLICCPLQLQPLSSFLCEISVQTNTTAARLTDGFLSLSSASQADTKPASFVEFGSTFSCFCWFS